MANIFRILSILIVFIFSCSFKPGQDQKMPQEKIKPGTSISKSMDCQFKISVSPMGGFKVLSLGKKKAPPSLIVDDVTGVDWFKGKVLIYSVGSIYGRPGIYSYDCNVHQVTQLVNAKEINEHYPLGSDYFELYKLSEAENEISYYYAPDVDKIDFELFRQEKNIRKFRVKE